jgi:hypothetical protein
LVWIAGCWNSSNILLANRNPKNNCLLSAFLEQGTVVNIAVCAHTNRDPNKQEVGFFLYEAAQNFKVFSKLQN